MAERIKECTRYLEEDEDDYKIGLCSLIQEWNQRLFLCWETLFSNLSMLFKLVFVHFSLCFVVFLYIATGISQGADGQMSSE
jgi:hypothetical protein